MADTRLTAFYNIRQAHQYLSSYLFQRRQKLIQVGAKVDSINEFDTIERFDPSGLDYRHESSNLQNIMQELEERVTDLINSPAWKETSDPQAIPRLIQQHDWKLNIEVNSTSRSYNLTDISTIAEILANHAYNLHLDAQKFIKSLPELAQDLQVVAKILKAEEAKQRVINLANYITNINYDLSNLNKRHSRVQHLLELTSSLPNEAKQIGKQISIHARNLIHPAMRAKVNKSLAELVIELQMHFKRLVEQKQFGDELEMLKECITDLSTASTPCTDIATLQKSLKMIDKAVATIHDLSYDFAVSDNYYLSREEAIINFDRKRKVDLVTEEKTKEWLDDKATRLQNFLGVHRLNITAADEDFDMEFTGLTFLTSDINNLSKDALLKSIFKLSNIILYNPCVPAGIKTFDAKPSHSMLLAVMQTLNLLMQAYVQLTEVIPTFTSVLQALKLSHLQRKLNDIIPQRPSNKKIDVRKVVDPVTAAMQKSNKQYKFYKVHQELVAVYDQVVKITESYEDYLQIMLNEKQAFILMMDIINKFAEYIREMLFERRPDFSFAKNLVQTSTICRTFANLCKSMAEDQPQKFRSDVCLIEILPLFNNIHFLMDLTANRKLKATQQLKEIKKALLEMIFLLVVEGKYNKDKIEEILTVYVSAKKTAEFLENPDLDLSQYPLNIFLHMISKHYATNLSAFANRKKFKINYRNLANVMLDTCSAEHLQKIVDTAAALLQKKPEAMLSEIASCLQSNTFREDFLTMREKYLDFVAKKPLSPLPSVIHHSTMWVKPQEYKQAEANEKNRSGTRFAPCPL